MRLIEIVGDDEESIYKKLMSIWAMLTACELAPPSEMKDSIIQKYSNMLSEDRENLTVWVIKSPKIGELYNKLPAKYR